MTYPQINFKLLYKRYDFHPLSWIIGQSKPRGIRHIFQFSSNTYFHLRREKKSPKDIPISQLIVSYSMVKTGVFRVDKTRLYVRLHTRTSHRYRPASTFHSSTSRNCNRANIKRAGQFRTQICTASDLFFPLPFIVCVTILVSARLINNERSLSQPDIPKIFRHCGELPVMQTTITLTHFRNYYLQTKNQIFEKSYSMKYLEILKYSRHNKNNLIIIKCFIKYIYIYLCDVKLFLLKT